MSIQYTVPGFEPTTLEHESSPITTRPGLPPRIYLSFYGPFVCFFSFFVMFLSSKVVTRKLRNPSCHIPFLFSKDEFIDPRRTNFIFKPVTKILNSSLRPKAKDSRNYLNCCCCCCWLFFTYS